MAGSNVLIYLLRRDLRVSDNPILHHLATSTGHGFTHLLPVYVFPPHQIEISGLVSKGGKSPYPEARSQVGRFWRCGPYRVKFMAQSVWNLKTSLEELGSGLAVRAGTYVDVLKSLVEGLGEKKLKVGAVWMTSEEGVEEKRDEKSVSSFCSTTGVQCKMWHDEKYFVDDRDVKLKSPHALPDVFTSYRKMVEPLRERPRATVPKPPKSSLPPYPDAGDIPSQAAPFDVPSSYDELEKALVSPVKDFMADPPAYPPNAKSAHPFEGGESHARARLDHIIKSDAVFNYKRSRNGLLGEDFSTKLSAYLALGCITARSIHASLLAYEDGTSKDYANARGYGQGDNEGSQAVRFELLWRDYMRLCTRKFSHKLFRRSGFRDDCNVQWKTPKVDGASLAATTPKGKESPVDPKDDVDHLLRRVLDGTTGMGLIDASQRELLHTGYTSNRARQNVASFLAKHLAIDWRYGAEWYEMVLIDYDVSSNWANWQYVAGVGNDPRGEARIFNPVKQAFDYDHDGEYVRCWVPELRPLEKVENVFQAWTTFKEDWDRFGLTDNPMAERPVKKIEFLPHLKPKNAKRPFDRRRRDGRIRGNVVQATGEPAHIPESPVNPRTGGGPEAHHNPHGGGDQHRGGRGGQGGRPGGYRGRGAGPAAGHRGFSGGRGQYGHPSDRPAAWVPPPPPET